jgi:gluconolactonase
MELTRRELLALAGGLPLERKVIAELVCKVPSYCEGVVFDHSGFKYISHGKYISRVGPDGVPSRWAETKAPNGHKILGDGTHLVCDGSAKAVLHLDAKGQAIGNAADSFEGKPLMGPNDLTLDRAGGFYFTDPAATDEDRVFHVDRSGTVHLVAKGLSFPNGIALRPDGKELLFGESKKNRILAVKVIGECKWSEPRLFASLPAKGAGQIDNMPDGMCLDRDGNLYVAHWGMRQVQVVDRAGKVIRSYASGNLTTSNAAFGGAAMNELYVTGALEEEKSSEGGLFRLRLEGVKGLRILPKKT